MKWKNIDVGAAPYYLTATVTEWLPLLRCAEVRQRVCDDIAVALKACGGSFSAFVIMPDHLHMLVCLPEGEQLHRFNKLWRGRSGRHIPKILASLNAHDSLVILAAHAKRGCRYAAWKEQVRALAMWSSVKLLEKIDYIHNNPVRRGLVEHPGDWTHSSYGFYEHGTDVCLDVTPIEP